MKANGSRRFDGRLAAYLSAAGAIGSTMASEASADVVYNTTPQPFGINGVVDIDFNSDGQIDFQIDHDRVDADPTAAVNNVDYLQIDKNDINGELNPLDFDPAFPFGAATFPAGMTTPNNAADAAYYTGQASLGYYPAALNRWTSIGPGAGFDFQENNDFNFSGDWIRANRLIDEDMTQIDQNIGGRPAADIQAPFGSPGWDGISATRYLGLRMKLNGSSTFNYGWVGVKITNQDDATGIVTGWGYETTPNTALFAGIVPEPTSIVSALMGVMFAGCFLWRRWIRR